MLAEFLTWFIRNVRIVYTTVESTREFQWVSEMVLKSGFANY